MSNADYAVFRDEHRHTCIRVHVGSKYVEFIPMHATEVAVHKLDEKSFVHEYELMPDYPVKRAAELYLFTENFKTFSAKASEHLKRIVADPAYNYDAQKFKPIIKKEIIMATKTKPVAAATQAEKISGGKGKPVAATKPTKTKPEAAPAAATKPTKTKATAAPAAATDGAVRRGRASAIAGMKIAVVKGAANPAREGSKRAALLHGVTQYKLVDDAVGATVTYGEGTEAVITPGDVNFAVELGLITLA